MAIAIDERYVVHAPVGPVWELLIDPRRVVGCVPGGELGAVIDERTFDGRVRVAVGPLTLAYSGRVHLAEVDVAAHRVKITGDARETAGTDSARLTLESWLAALPDGSTEVVTNARVDVVGRIVELGRGVLEPLGHLVFQQFASCVRATVEAEHAAVATGAYAAAPPKAARQEPLRAIPLVFLAVKAGVAGGFRAR
jgi:carbon monoxide dehydrogenase subunit G